jgi:hypothetical protein
MSASNPPPGQRRGRLFIIGFLIVVGAVVAQSLTSNFARMGPCVRVLADQAADTRAKFEVLEISSGSKRHCFRIEMARTDADRARGLMFRQSMPADQGMLFDFERDQMVSMWMRNTFIPLDMLFVFADGRIHRIEHRTEVQSERTISSGVPVRAVLELNAGVSERLGIKSGDRLVHPMFKR